VKKSSLILLIALATALVSFVLFFKFLKDSSKPKHRYVMAISAIKAEQVITKEQLSYTEPTASSGDDGNLFAQMADVAGKVAVHDMKPGDWILRSSVKEKAPPPRIVEVTKKVLRHEKIEIPEGMEGLNIKSSDINDVPNDLNPGDYVDILANISNYAGQKELITLIHSAQIVGIEFEDAETLTTIKSIRLALLPRETKAVLAGLAQGKLQLVLLAGLGEKPWTGPPVGEMEIIRANNQQRALVAGRMSEEAQNVFEKIGNNPAVEAVLEKTPS
jgi:Flp pilus assembly protein CpaB